MATFKYTALKQDGTKVNGTEVAADKAALVGVLELKSLLLLSSAKVVDRSQKKGARHEKKIKLDELILFTRQFATMFRVGMPLLRSLHLLKDQVESSSLRRVVAAIAADVEAGEAMARAFGKHPKVFPPIYCSMLAAGEASGNVSIVMEKLCQSMEYESEVKSQIKGALQYPIIVLIALSGAFAALMGFVVPSFLPLFDQLGGELPPVTQVCVALSSLFTDYWYLLVGGAVAITGAFMYANRTEKGKLAISRAIIRIPLVGKLMVFSFMARFGSLLSILQASGILIVDSLKIIAECIDNAAIRQEITRVGVDVENGKSIAASLETSLCFPQIMQSMIAIGEASGNLEEMMSESSRHFEVEINHAVKSLTGAIGPILIVFMAIAVGFFAMAIYLPIWKITEMQMAQ